MYKILEEPHVSSGVYSVLMEWMGSYNQKKEKEKIDATKGGVKKLII